MYVSEAIFWLSLVLDVLGLIAGILLFVHPWIAFFSINILVVCYLVILE